MNVHYRVKGPAQPRMIGFNGGGVQWAVLRSDHVSVTVSATGQIVDRSAGELASQIWREVAPALQTLGLAITAEKMPDIRVVKEKRASISQASGSLPQPPLRPLSDVTLAGD